MTAPNSAIRRENVASTVKVPAKLKEFWNVARLPQS